MGRPPTISGGGNGSIPFMDFSYHNVDVMVGLIAVLCFIHYA